MYTSIMDSYILLYILVVLIGISVGGRINNVTSTLTLPSFYPPTYLFGLAWTILFFIFGIFLYYASTELQIIGIIYFALVLAWTPLFVYSKSTAVGFYYLFLVVLLTISLFFVSEKQYAHPYPWLLVPQFLWTSFATIIAYELYRLNG
jgi:benzodiazapine receptor